MRTQLPSRRETTVLILLAWGYSNKAVAERLELSVKTVEAHRYNGLRKLKLFDRPGLVRYAVDHGWLKPDADPKTTTDVSEQPFIPLATE